MENTSNAVKPVSMRFKQIASLSSIFYSSLKFVTSIYKARKCNGSNPAKLSADSAICNDNNPVVKQVLI